MIFKMKKISFTFLAFIAIFSATAQHRATSDDLGLAPNSYWNGSTLSGGFQDGDAYFPNQYDTTYASWGGFAYSNVPLNIDTITSGATDYNYQYSSAEGGGVYGSSAFGICYTSGSYTTLNLKGFAPGHQIFGLYVTNSAYDYLSMKYGDQFGKKFGGTHGTDPDWFQLTITGWYQGNLIADSVNFYLADFRSADTTQHFILKSWKFIDLMPLGNVDSLFFTLSSSDTGIYGMNTPAYFDLDNFMTTDGVTYSSPVVVTDSFRFTYIDTLTGNADTLHANILSNATLPPFLQYTVSLIQGASFIGATAYLNAGDSLVYIPAAGVQGTDTLRYSVCDELGTCDTAQIFVTILGPNNTGIVDVGLPDLHLYPNPASSYLLVSYSSTIQAISITDMSGREVMQRDINNTAASVNIEALSAGVYTVLIHTADGIAARRLIKE
jgi:hypothetical protein